MKGKCFIIALAALFITTIACVAHAADWTEWQQLEDKAYNGLSFSYKSDCAGANDTACTLWWGFKNGYDKEVDVKYTITYQATDGSSAERTATVHLRQGANELPEFRVTGRKLLSVTAELALDKKEKSQVTAELTRREQERLRKEKEERLAKEKQERIAAAAAKPYKKGEPAEVTAYREQQRMAQFQEEERRRYEEDMRRIEEDGRRRRAELEEQQRRDEEAQRQREEDQRRQEEAQRYRKQQDREETARRNREHDENMNRIITEGAQGIGNALTQGLTNYYNVKQDGAEAVRHAQEEQQRAQREAERRERERQEEARQERERERREQERQRLAQEETDRREREARETREREARERREQERRDAEAREHQQQANAGTWEVGDFTVTAWGSDKLYLNSSVMATVTNSSGEPEFSGTYVKLINNYKTHSIQYSISNSNHTDRTLDPGKEILVPLNLKKDITRSTSVVLRVRYWKGEGQTVGSD